MRKQKFSGTHTLFIFVVLFLLSCTKNPFDSDRLSSNENRITGKVELSDQTTPDSIYVWLEALDVGTWTDKTGWFEMNLPPSTSLPDENLTGIFKLYFYLANYALETSDIVLRNGKVQASHGDLNSNRELNQPKYLTKILEVRTTVKPNSFPVIPEADTVTIILGQAISIELTLRALGQPVSVKYPDRSKGALSILFIKRVDPGAESIEIWDLDGSTLHAELITEKVSQAERLWVTYYYLTVGRLTKGNYQIIPYFIIDQPSIPSGLLNHISNNLFSPVPDFLKIPIKRKGGDFKVIY